MRRFLLSFLLLIPAPAQESDALYDRLQDFNTKYKAFVLEYLSCSPRTQLSPEGIPQGCTGAGEFNVKSWNQAKHSAEKLFGLVPAP